MMSALELLNGKLTWSISESPMHVKSHNIHPRKGGQNKEMKKNCNCQASVWVVIFNRWKEDTLVQQ